VSPHIIALSAVGTIHYGHYSRILPRRGYKLPDWAIKLGLAGCCFPSRASASPALQARYTRRMNGLKTTHSALCILFLTFRGRLSPMLEYFWFLVDISTRE
jgi:hypothetical protein